MRRWGGEFDPGAAGLLVAGLGGGGHDEITPNAALGWPQVEFCRDMQADGPRRFMKGASSLQRLISGIACPASLRPSMEDRRPNAGIACDLFGQPDVACPFRHLSDNRRARRGRPVTSIFELEHRVERAHITAEALGGVLNPQAAVAISPTPSVCFAVYAVETDPHFGAGLPFGSFQGFSCAAQALL